MELNRLQKTVDDWIKKYGVRYFDELTNMAQLTEEVGEVARIISRKYGEQVQKKGEKVNDLGEELALVLQENGYSNIYVFKGGWKKWSDTDLPFNKNE